MSAEAVEAVLVLLATNALGWQLGQWGWAAGGGGGGSIEELRCPALSSRSPSVLPFQWSSTSSTVDGRWSRLGLVSVSSRLGLGWQ
jgi:hypothetical protein